jgi:hypothetical protein
MRLVPVGVRPAADLPRRVANARRCIYNVYWFPSQIEQFPVGLRRRANDFYYTGADSNGKIFSDYL